MGTSVNSLTKVLRLFLKGTSSFNSATKLYLNETKKVQCRTLTTEVTPKVDIAFKKIFGVEENKDLLIEFINATVSEEDRVTDLTILNPYNQKSFKHDKISILDVKALGQNGKRFNVEIQLSNEFNYHKRALYYWAKLYTEQLQNSRDYSTLNKAIGIHILNFISITDSRKYHNVFHIKEKESGLHYFSDFEMHTIELSKFSNDANESVGSLLQKMKTALDTWAVFFTHHDLLDKMTLPASLASNSLKKALHVLETMNFTDEERMSYEDRLKWLRMETSAIMRAKVEARAEGKLEGERECQLKIAQSLLRDGFDIDKIVSHTGLCRSDVERLK